MERIRRLLSPLTDRGQGQAARRAKIRIPETMIARPNAVATILGLTRGRLDVTASGAGASSARDVVAA